MMLPDVHEDYEQQARILAAAHRRVDPSTLEIHLSPDPQRSVIRLLEVSRSVPNTGETFPFQYAPAGDIRYRSAVILLSQDDWEQVKSGQLLLPEGWSIENLRAL